MATFGLKPRVTYKDIEAVIHFWTDTFTDTYNFTLPCYFRLHCKSHSRRSCPRSILKQWKIAGVDTAESGSQSTFLGWNELFTKGHMTLDSFTYSALLILSLIMISTLERKLKVCKDLYLNTSQAWKLPKGKTICAFQESGRMGIRHWKAQYVCSESTSYSLCSLHSWPGVKLPSTSSWLGNTFIHWPSSSLSSQPFSLSSFQQSQVRLRLENKSNNCLHYLWDLVVLVSKILSLWQSQCFKTNMCPIGGSHC